MAGEKEVSFTIRAKDAASAVLKQVENSVKGTAEKMFSFKTALGAVSGLAAGFSLGVIIKDLFDLGVAADKSFRQISANLPTAHAGLTQLRDDMRALADESGRSAADIQAAAVEISRLGVSSASELSTRLRAATTFADATGLDLKATVQGLDQVMDEFSLSAEQAEEMLARLRSASKGRGDVESMFAAFTAGAPALVKLGIDADTATKALVALLDKGIAPARAGKMLLQYDGSALRELASDAKIATDAVAQLHKEADENRASFERDAQRIKNELSEIGLTIADKILVPLRGWKLLIEEIKSAGGIQGIFPGLKSFTLQSPVQAGLVGPFDGGNHGTSGSWGDPATPGKPGKLPLTKDENAALAEAKKKVAELRLEFEKLAATNADAAPKSQQFAQAIAAFELKLRSAKRPAEEINEQLRVLHRALGELRASETTEAIQAIDDAFTKLSNDALATFDAEVKKTITDLEKAAAAASGWDARVLNERIDELKTKFGALRAAVADTADIDQALKDWQSFLDHDSGNLSKSIAIIEIASNKLDEFKRAKEKATDPAAIKKYNDEIEKLDGFLRKLLGDTGQGLFSLPPKTEQATKHAAALASAWGTVGRSVIAAAQAMGQMSSETAATLQNVVSLGEGITRMFAGDMAGGGAEAATSIASLVAGLFKGGPSQEEIDGRNNSVAKLFTGIMQQLGGVNSVGNTITNERQRFADARLQVERDLGGKRNEAEREAKLRELNELEAQRIKQLTDEYAAIQESLQQDYEVRRLRAVGRTEEADAIAFFLEQQREYAAEVKAGANATTLAALAAAQLAEAQKRQADEAHEAAKRLLGDAVTRAQQALAIDDITDPSKIFGAKAAAYAGAGGALGKLFEGLDLANLSTDDIANLDAKLRDLFHQLQESPGAVDMAGLSIEDLIAALLDLDRAADDVAAGVNSAAMAMAAALDKLSVDEQIFGTDPTKHAGDLGGALGFDLSQFDLSTKAGVDAAIAYLQDLYNQDPTRGKDIAQVIGALKQIPFASGPIDLTKALGDPGLSSISHGFQSLTTTQADRLADIDLRQLNVLIEIRDLLSGTVSTPRLRGVNLGAAAASLTAGASLVIGTVEVHVTSDKENAEQEGRDAARGFAEELRRIDADLGRKVLVRERYNGSIRVTI